MSLESLSFPALGTTCHVFGLDCGAAPLANAAAWVGTLQLRLTRFDADSELSHLNSSAGPWVPVSSDLEALLREALRAHRVSGGLVHAGILNVLLAAGYTRTFRLGPTPSTLETAEFQGLPPLPEILEVSLGRARLRPGFGIDLGGIAKGWMADRLAEQIGENCLANLGGDLFARGGGPDGKGWPVGFGGTTVLLRDQGAATSGTRGRSWGDGLHHLIDPRTGRPSESNLAEVSVVAASAADAEVFAKTALLLGRASAGFFLEHSSPGWWLSS